MSAIDKSLAGVLRQMRKDIDALWRRVSRTAPVAGTTALRDITFPPPTTVAERVDLANAQVTWWNIELGWEESYYAPTGSPGLTARGLVPGAPAGWYPTGLGPKIRLAGSGTTPATSGWREFDVWAPLGNTEGSSWRNSTLIERAAGVSYVNILLAGRYDLTGDMALPGGSGSIVLALSVFRPSTSAYTVDRQVGTNLITGYGQMIPQYHKNFLCQVGDRPHLRVYSPGAVAFGDATHQTFFDVQYISPPLVTS